MRVTKQMLSIPPYLATAWEHVAAIRVEAGVLIVKMMDGTHAEVPGLSEEQLKEIFRAHAAYVESNSRPSEGPLGGMPFRVFPGGIEAMGGSVQHDPQNSNAPDLPEEVLSKIGQISQIIGGDVVGSAPEPHEGCNCFHCQIAAAIRGKSKEEPIPEEEVSDEELQFCNWDVESRGDHLYSVTSRLNRNESYSVYLGDPVGCTCGEGRCEHIEAALRN